MKQCSECKKYKPLDEFPRGAYRKRTQDYATLKRCRVCHRGFTRKHKEKYYKNNRKEALERARVQRESDPDGMREYHREYYRKNRDRKQKEMKEYALTEQGKEAVRRAQKNYRNRPDYNFRQNARKQVYRAVKSGKLIKPDKCTQCHTYVELEGHHEDYSKPLEVIWLCKRCHENIHHLNEGHES